MRDAVVGSGVMCGVCNGNSGKIQNVRCAEMPGRWEQATGDAGIGGSLMYKEYRVREKRT